MIYDTDLLGLGLDPAEVLNVPVRPGQRRYCELFAGAGGTMIGSLWAYRELKDDVFAVAINHNENCVNTHRLNLPQFLHLCTGVNRVYPKHVLRGQDLDDLSGSAPCTHFSSARGGAPVNPQERATCRQLIYWVRQSRPVFFRFENVKDFRSYGRVRQLRDKDGIPQFLRNEGTAKKSKWVLCLAPGKYRPKGTSNATWWARLEAKHGLRPAFEPDPRYMGEYYQKFLRDLRRAGYDVQAAILNAADFGAATSRERLFIYGVRRDTGMKVVWPNPTHARPDAAGNVPAGCLPWRTAESVIDRSLRGESVFKRQQPLKPRTIERIVVGLRKFGMDTLLSPSNGGTVPFLIKYRGTNFVADFNRPLPTITAGGTHLGLIEATLRRIDREETDSDGWADLGSFVLSQQSGGSPRSLSEPLPTIATSGAIALIEVLVRKLASSPGTGLPTFRFGDDVYELDIRHRMLQPHELAAAQSFPSDYVFAGTKTEIIKQIGNAVPPVISRAMVKAFWTQNPNVGVAANNLALAA